MSIKNKYNIWYNARARRLREDGIFSYITGSRGYILIIVLIVTALLAGVASDFIVIQLNHIRFLKKYERIQKAEILAMTGVELGKMFLDADIRGYDASYLTGKKGEKKTDSYFDIWAVEFPPFPMDPEKNEGVITLHIDDEQKKINASALANQFVNPTPYYGITQRLLISLGYSMDSADVIIDWVDSDDSKYSYGAESDYYGTLPSPYTTRNGSFYAPGELMMLKGITPAMYHGLEHTKEDEKTTSTEKKYVLNNDNRLPLKMDINKELDSDSEEQKKNDAILIYPEKSNGLKNYFTVYGDASDFLDTSNRININTASYRVLSALTDDMTDDKVAEIIKRRMVTPYTTVESLSDIIEDKTVRENLLTVKSSIFKIEVSAEYQGTVRRVTVIYNRTLKKYMSFQLH